MDTEFVVVEELEEEEGAFDETTTVDMRKLEIEENATVDKLKRVCGWSGDDYGFGLEKILLLFFFFFDSK